MFVVEQKFYMDGSKLQITLKEYIKIAEHDKEFRFGECIIEVDTTDFATVSYEYIFKQIQIAALWEFQ